MECPSPSGARAGIPDLPFSFLENGFDVPPDGETFPLSLPGYGFTDGIPCEVQSQPTC